MNVKASFSANEICWTLDHHTSIKPLGDKNHQRTYFLCNVIAIDSLQPFVSSGEKLPFEGERYSPLTVNAVTDTLPRFPCQRANNLWAWDFLANNQSSWNQSRQTLSRLIGFHMPLAWLRGPFQPADWVVTCAKQRTLSVMIDEA